MFLNDESTGRCIIACIASSSLPLLSSLSEDSSTVVALLSVLEASSSISAGSKGYFHCDALEISSIGPVCWEGAPLVLMGVYGSWDTGTALCFCDTSGVGGRVILAPDTIFAFATVGPAVLSEIRL